MKKKLFISILVMLLVTIQSQAQESQTEEYAIVDVIELRKKKIIRVTIGGEPASEKEWKKEKTDVAFDFTPVLDQLKELNKKGFELLNMSTAYETIGGGQTANHGIPRFTFFMVKKTK